MDLKKNLTEKLFQAGCLEYKDGTWEFKCPNLIKNTSLSSDFIFGIATLVKAIQKRINLEEKNYLVILLNDTIEDQLENATMPYVGLEQFKEDDFHEKFNDMNQDKKTELIIYCDVMDMRLMEFIDSKLIYEKFDLSVFSFFDTRDGIKGTLRGYEIDYDYLMSAIHLPVYQEAELVS